jgi:hypothetical protein
MAIRVKYITAGADSSGRVCYLLVYLELPEKNCSNKQKFPKDCRFIHLAAHWIHTWSRLQCSEVQDFTVLQPLGDSHSRFIQPVRTVSVISYVMLELYWIRQSISCVWLRLLCTKLSFYIYLNKWLCASSCTSFPKKSILSSTIDDIQPKTMITQFSGVCRLIKLVPLY